MGFGDAIKTCFSKYVTISGRAARSEYWWFYLFTMIVGTIPTQIGIALESVAIMIIGLILSLALIIPGFCVSVRRMHDKDKSGWWLLIGLVPIIGVILIIYWFVTRGTEGDNQFGPDPLA